MLKVMCGVVVSKAPSGIVVLGALFLLTYQLYDLKESEGDI